MVDCTLWTRSKERFASAHFLQQRRPLLYKMLSRFVVFALALPLLVTATPWGTTSAAPRVSFNRISYATHADLL